MGREVPKEHELVSSEQLPFSVDGTYPADYSGHFSHTKMIDSLNACKQMLDRDNELRSIIFKYIKAMEMYTNQIRSERSHRQRTISELIEKGLVWSALTSDLLRVRSRSYIPHASTP